MRSKTKKGIQEEKRVERKEWVSGRIESEEVGVNRNTRIRSNGLAINRGNTLNAAEVVLQNNY